MEIQQAAAAIHMQRIQSQLKRLELQVGIGTCIALHQMSGLEPSSMLLWSVWDDLYLDVQVMCKIAYAT